MDAISLPALGGIAISLLCRTPLSGARLDLLRPRKPLCGISFARGEGAWPDYTVGHGESHGRLRPSLPSRGCVCLYARFRELRLIGIWVGTRIFYLWK